MKKITLLCTLLAASITLQAQNIDSLVNVLNTQKLTPAEKLDLYEKLCYEGMSYDITKTTIYAREGLRLAEKEKNKVKSSIFNEYLGIACYMKAGYDSAHIYLNKALALAVEAKDLKQEISVCISNGASYGREGKYTAALECFMRALPLCEATGDSSGTIKILENIGGMHRILNNPDRATSYFEQAIAISEKDNNAQRARKSYYELGTIYKGKKEFDKATTYALKALEASKSSNNKIFESLSLQLLANISCELKNYDKAEVFANENVRICKEIDEPMMLASAWFSLSTVYIGRKDYKKCEEAARKAWEIDSTAADLKAFLAFNLSYSYIFLGDKLKAAKYFCIYDDFMKQSNEEKFRETLTEMEVKYEAEKKDIQIASLEKEKKLSGWLTIAGAAILLLAIGLLLVRHRLNVQKRKLAEQQVKQLRQEKQLVAAQAVMDGETSERSRLARDLHDGLGGMLSVVKLNLKDMKSYSIMDGQDVDRFYSAMEMLDESIGELRRVAHHMMPESLIRYGLKASLEDFCRAIPGAHFRYLGENPRIDSHLEVLIYRCAYELVNNAVKYAQASNINVQLVVDSGLVALTVHDNGVGFNPETVAQGSGLENIRTRVDAYNGKMNIYSSPGKGTEVSIEIEQV